MKKLSGFIDYLSLLFRTKFIELSQRNKRIKSYNGKNDFINAFLDLKNFRGTYDIIGFLIYTKIICDSENKKCNLILFRNHHTSRNGYIVNPGKEKNFLENGVVDFRNDFITHQLLNLVENFKPNIYLFDEMHEAERFFDEGNILIPSNAKIDKLIDWDDYYIKINDYYRQNKKVPSLKCPEYIKEFLLKYLKLSENTIGKGIITITLRNSSYAKVRNSNNGEWAKFYEWVEKKGYYPIFVNDTEKIDNLNNIVIKEKKYNCLNIASLNCNIRLALYEIAYLNTGVACGPTLCLVFSKYNRYLLFKTFVEDEESNASLKNFEKINGFSFGKQWPFAKRSQKIVWNSSDSFDILKKEFMEFENESN